jgi:SAM-dependent methyltransferase
MAEITKSSPVVRLNLGSGIHLRRDFINVDKYYTREQIASKSGFFINAIVEEGAEYVQADIKELPFEDNYADYVELMNTIEHFPMRHVVEYMKEIHRVMKPGAALVLVTNNMTGLALDWLHMVTTAFDLERYVSVSETIYGNQGGDSEGELHRVPFTTDFLNHVLVQAGFKDGKLYLVPEGMPMPKIGTIEPIDKTAVARNDLLIAEVTK